MPTEPDNPNTELLRPKKRIGVSTLFVLAMLIAVWVLVAVPGYPKRSRPFYSNPEWRGDAVIRTFGWPYVHRAKLSINDKFGSISPVDIAGQATEERFDASLQSLQWSKTTLLKEISRPPTLMPARYNEYDLSAEKRFWSDPQNWKYWDSDASFTQWYSYGLLANGLILLVFLFLVAVCLEYLRRRRKRWFQLSLLDFLALVLVVGAVASVYSYETQLGQQQIELQAKIGDDPFSGLSLSVRLKNPTFLPRLVNGSAGWKRLVPDQAYFRVTQLEIDTSRFKNESKFNELVELLKSNSLNYVEHIDIKVVGQDRFFILDLLPAENVYTIDIKILAKQNNQARSSKHPVLKKL